MDVHELTDLLHQVFNQSTTIAQARDALLEHGIVLPVDDPPAREWICLGDCDPTDRTLVTVDEDGCCLACGGDVVELDPAAIGPIEVLVGRLHDAERLLEEREKTATRNEELIELLRQVFVREKTMDEIATALLEAGIVLPTDREPWWTDLRDQDLTDQVRTPVAVLQNIRATRGDLERRIDQIESILRLLVADDRVALAEVDERYQGDVDVIMSRIAGLEVDLRNTKRQLEEHKAITDRIVDAFNHGVVDRERYPFAGLISECRDVLGARASETLLVACTRVAEDLRDLRLRTLGYLTEVSRATGVEQPNLDDPDAIVRAVEDMRRKAPSEDVRLIALHGRIAELEEDNLEARCLGVSDYARHVERLLDDLDYPPASKSNHGVLEDVEQRVRLQAEALEGLRRMLGELGYFGRLALQVQHGECNQCVLAHKSKTHRHPDYAGGDL